ncbi:MAG TPA: SMC-Scp complex subunit ScpB [Candidatus Andersenbacteria bacterium]|nr:SMC-Scp complex subunit ScpB [Candidatus Andersenbacteria bacterium]
MTSLAQHIEALLFTAGEAVLLSEMAQILNVQEAEIVLALQEISNALQGQGIALVTTATHAQLVTSQSVAEFLAQFLSQDDKELSRAAMETLSVIAYRGPISRYDIDTIRGVDSRRMIRQLLLRGLLRQIRTAGQTSLYDISEEFLMKLGMTNKKELPEFASLSISEHLNRLLEETK